MVDFNLPGDIKAILLIHAFNLFFRWHHDASHDDSLAEHEDQEGRNGRDDQRGVNDPLMGLALQLEYPDHDRPHLLIGDNYQGHHELAVSADKSAQGDHRQDRFGQIHSERPEFRPFTGPVQISGFIQLTRQAIEKAL